MSLADNPSYGTLLSKLYDVLVKETCTEFLMDVRVQAKRMEAKARRANGACHICGQNCPSYSGSSRSNGAAGATSGSSGSGTSNSTPAPMLEPPSITGSSRTGTPVPGTGSQLANANPLKPEIYSANPLFECLICSRQVGINRYAHHLAKCLGIGGKEKSARKVGNASASTSDAGGTLQHSARILSVLETRRRQRAPDASLQALKEMEAIAERGYLKGKKLNANGKRAPSPVLGGPHWKKMKTNTPPPGSTVNREDHHMVRSQSALPQSSVPTFASPLNPNKQRAGSALLDSNLSREVSPSLSASTAAGANDTFETGSNAGSVRGPGRGRGRGRGRGGSHGSGRGGAASNRAAASSPTAGAGAIDVGASSSALSEESPLKLKIPTIKATNGSDDGSYHESNSDSEMASLGGVDDEESEMSEESSLED